ncbi:hypothetical protein EVAR_32984_1 [Eumeta japonica]|uniref:Uncharacterized protein n=1 Tax=Eumeta variegata TaxID=151549 RepID=A0A4C1VQ52_EUMVA|nr:hypothetical protein EVAR_32984_1 [Eumeta japonica]
MCNVTVTVIHLKEYECGLKIDELFMKCLLHANDEYVLRHRRIAAGVGVRRLLRTLSGVGRSEPIFRTNSDTRGYAFVSTVGHADTSIFTCGLIINMHGVFPYNISYKRGDRRMGVKRV